MAMQRNARMNNLHPAGREAGLPTWNPSLPWKASQGSLSAASTEGPLTVLPASPHAAQSEPASAPFEEAARTAAGWAAAGGSSRLSKSKSSWEGAGLVGLLTGAGEATRAGRLLELVERTGGLAEGGGEATRSALAPGSAKAAHHHSVNGLF